MAVLYDVCKGILGVGPLPLYVVLQDASIPPKHEKVFVLLMNTFDYFDAGDKLGCQICILFLSLMSQKERDRLNKETLGWPGVNDVEGFKIMNDH